MVAAQAQNEVKVFVTDSQSWSVGKNSGGARPQTVEIMKTFYKNENCEAITITLDENKADYIVVLDHEGGKGLVWKDNKVAVFNAERELIYANSTRKLGSAVKDACKSITASIQQSSP